MHFKDLSKYHVDGDCNLRRIQFIDLDQVKPRIDVCLLQVLLHVLFEHAAGYALFAVKEVEEIGMLLPQVGIRRRSSLFLPLADTWG